MCVCWVYAYGFHLVVLDSSLFWFCVVKNSWDVPSWVRVWLWMKTDLSCVIWDFWKQTSVYNNLFQISSSMEWFHTFIWCNRAQETCCCCRKKPLVGHLTRFAARKLSNNSLNYINLTLIAPTFYVSFNELVLFVEDSALKHLPIGAETIKLQCAQIV